ncbi:hypothetical protein B0H12DRAFT_1074941 [Mycena haematopus]|nr:hypothetical protein B0H12DRAFT_1074941 [Mycena haematopus]
MARGRPRLDSETKQDHVLNSRKLYEDKQVPYYTNSDCSLNTVLSFQESSEAPKRAAIAAGDFKAEYEYRRKAAEASERYRARAYSKLRKDEKERAEIRVAAAVKRRARKTEAENLRQKHAPSAQLQSKRVQPVAPPVARPRRRSPQSPKPRRISDVANDDEESSEEDNEGSTDGNSDAEHAQRLANAPRFERRCPAPPTCSECDEDRARHSGWFYAVVSPGWKGVVTSRETRTRTLARFPDGSTFKAKTWEDMQTAWAHDCIKHHDHDDDEEDRVAPSSTPLTLSPPPSPSPPSTPTVVAASRSPSPSPNTEARQIATEARRLAHIEAFRAEAEAQGVASQVRTRHKLTKDDLAFLSSNRPPPVPLSPRRARQQFDRVLGAPAVAAALASLSVDAPTQTGAPTPAPTPTSPVSLSTEDADGQTSVSTALAPAGARFVRTKRGLILLWVDPETQERRRVQLWGTQRRRSLIPEFCRTFLSLVFKFLSLVFFVIYAIFSILGFVFIVVILNENLYQRNEE